MLLRTHAQSASKRDSAAYLGIECGATKTTALLDPGNDGKILRGEFGPANVRLLDDATLRAHFAVINKYFGKPAMPLVAIAVAMAGARTESDRKRIRAAANLVWPNVTCHATNDLEPALLAAPPSDDAPQVLILSGTGSSCYGRTAKGKTLRFGGWGHTLGDRGSGYDIALQALKAVIHEFDRTGQWPTLGARFLAALLLNTPDDLIDWVRRAEKKEIAALAKEVFAAAPRDSLARNVLSAAAESLANDGVDCAARIVKKNVSVQFVLAGSVLTKQPKFAKEVAGLIRRARPRSEIVVLEREAVWGALELARGSAITAETQPVRPVGILPRLTSMSPTEQRNPRSMKLDELPIGEAVALMIDEETSIAPALRKVLPQIEQTLKLIVASFKRGGRLFYVGAGTSGRLGVLDASECPPTFRVSPEQVQGIIAGGQTALWNAVEGMEDDPNAGAAAIVGRNVNNRDVVMGIAASGRTPFMWGALAEARQRGAKTILLSFNPYLEIPKAVAPDVWIAADVGPEVLTGSTRLKSGTATKIILNTLTTLAMVQTGKVLSNLMIDVNPSNEKLRERAIRIVRAVTGASDSDALQALDRSKWIVKDASRSLK